MAYADPADQRAAVKRHYDANRQYYIDKARKRKTEQIEYFRALKHNKSCTDCKDTFPWWILQWDHVGDDKVANVSDMIGAGFSRKRIEAEIAKCELVCANCHCGRTHNRRTTSSLYSSAEQSA